MALTDSTDPLAVGLDFLLGDSRTREALTYDGSLSLYGVVDRRPERAPENRQVDFRNRGDSIIEARKSAFTSTPEVGKSFVDADGASHRIQKFRSTDTTYVFSCTISRS